MAIHKFVRLLTQGRPIPMFGNGESERDYTYIDDIVDGIYRATQKVYKFEIFNLANSKTIKLRKLIELIANKLEIEAKIQQLPEQLGDVPITYSDISKVKRMLRYNPSTSIQDGVQNFIKWYKRKKNILGGVAVNYENFNPNPRSIS